MTGLAAAVAAQLDHRVEQGKPRRVTDLATLRQIAGLVGETRDGAPVARAREAS